jgi:hypothetical protein
MSLRVRERERDEEGEKTNIPFQFRHAKERTRTKYYKCLIGGNLRVKRKRWKASISPVLPS